MTKNINLKAIHDSIKEKCKFRSMGHCSHRDRYPGNNPLCSPDNCPIIFKDQFNQLIYEIAENLGAVADINHPFVITKPPGRHHIIITSEDGTPLKPGFVHAFITRIENLMYGDMEIKPKTKKVLISNVARHENGQSPIYYDVGLKINLYKRYILRFNRYYRDPAERSVVTKSYPIDEYDNLSLDDLKALLKQVQANHDIEVSENENSSKYLSNLLQDQWKLLITILKKSELLKGTKWKYDTHWNKNSLHGKYDDKDKKEALDLLKPILNDCHCSTKIAEGVEIIVSDWDIYIRFKSLDMIPKFIEEWGIEVDFSYLEERIKDTKDQAEKYERRHQSVLKLLEIFKGDQHGNKD